MLAVYAVGNEQHKTRKENIDTGNESLLHVNKFYHVRNTVGGESRANAGCVRRVRSEW